MDIPYAIVSSKARLGGLVGKKTTTCVALTDFKDNAAELENYCKIFREKFHGPPAHSRKPEKGFKAISRENKAQKELLAKTKKFPINYNNDFSTITHRVNIVKGSSLSMIKTSNTINAANMVKFPNIDCIKKRFIEGPLTINEIEEIQMMIMKE